MRFRKLILTMICAMTVFASNALAAVYQVDADHTTVSFKIRHLFSNVVGTFGKFEGTIDYEPGKPETWKTSGKIDVNSIDTNVAGRDKHLKTADFFDVEKYPTIEFKTTEVKDATEKSAKLTGLLKMHGVEKPVTLDVTIHGVGKDPWGNVRAGFTATTRIDRKEFGLNWNKTLETGGVLVGDEVDITIEAEGMIA